MKNTFILLSLAFAVNSFAQSSKELAPKQFLNSLSQLCGTAYKGKIVSTSVPEDFKDKELLMYVMECNSDQVKIPFFVGDDLSRTWIFTLKGERLELKHDHRKEGGVADEITMYGGTTTNTGTNNIQFFPADQQTVDLLAPTAGNVWYVTVDEFKFTYNLKRVDKESAFSVEFDLTAPVQTDKRPW
ncbi:hypothetical protein [Myroides sp. LoEW2-1]|uniref:hypothetical protein n=1 Tax=Myroides sp. LoEW2-1 TaxID=2683192 RepID=UPI0013275774|nr:hypothetical protein [Myroides sp. LoEW2-1]MVX35096.1 hypothetical protein [Myroides sp. LoEW2-1]